MNIFRNYQEGKYNTFESHFAELIPDSEWGIEFSILSDNIRTDSDESVVYRTTNPMHDGEWKIGSFADAQAALAKETEDFLNF